MGGGAADDDAAAHEDDVSAASQPEPESESGPESKPAAYELLERDVFTNSSKDVGSTAFISRRVRSADQNIRAQVFSSVRFCSVLFCSGSSDADAAGHSSDR